MRHLIGFFQLGTATLVHSRMSDQERRENIRKFREGNCKYILVCDLFNEGIDIPETNLLVFMRYTGSKTIWLQQLGRGLRKTPNKEFVHVLDFVGSLERLNEVKELSRAVQRLAVDRESLIDDIVDSSSPQIFHDGSLEVKYSAEAARVLSLIEDMKFLLNSREVLIDKLRFYKEKKNLIPLISDVTNSLVDVSYDQIATHFGSYYNYLVAAFGDDIDQQTMLDRLQEFIKTFYLKYSMKPSLRTISLNFMEEQLYEFSEKDIQLLLPDLMTIETEISVNSIENFELNNKFKTLSEECILIQKFKSKIFSRGDIKNLSINDQQEIKEKYQSISVFLKKLKDAQ